jgi:hypothetical protein
MPRRPLIGKHEDKNHNTFGLSTDVEVDVRPIAIVMIPGVPSERGDLPEPEAGGVRVNGREVPLGGITTSSQHRCANTCGIKIAHIDAYLEVAEGAALLSPAFTAHMSNALLKRQHRIHDGCVLVIPFTFRLPNALKIRPRQMEVISMLRVPAEPRWRDREGFAGRLDCYLVPL